MEDNYVFAKLAEVNNMLFKVLVARYKELNLNITPLQSRIIMLIYKSKDRICQKDLEGYIGCNKSTLSSVLSTMENNGFIERVGSLEDSRKNSIKLTESSLDIIHILDKDHQEIDNIILDGFDDEELANFKLFMEKLERNVERL